MTFPLPSLASLCRPVTRDEVRSYLRVTHTAEEAEEVLASLLSACRLCDGRLYLQHPDKAQVLPWDPHAAPRLACGALLAAVRMGGPA